MDASQQCSLGSAPALCPHVGFVVVSCLAVRDVLLIVWFSFLLKNQHFKSDDQNSGVNSYLEAVGVIANFVHQ